MTPLLAALGVWAFACGLTGFGWHWLIAVFVLIAVIAWRFELRVQQLAPAALVWLFFSCIAWASNFQGQLPNDQFFTLAWLHRLALSQAVGVSSDAKALVLGLAIGDNSGLSPALSSALKVVSLTHLSAVSGANCAIVIASCYFMLSRFQVRTRVALSLAALSGYVALVGPQPSVLRAATMSAFVLLAAASGRRVRPTSALALSVCVLIALNPSIVVSISFILSVAATAGLLWFAPLCYQKFRQAMPKWLAAGLAVSVAAQLFCFPILLQLQAGIPTYSLVANLIAEPLVAPITILGLVAICLSWFPPLAAGVYWLASCFAWLIASLASWLAGLPFATLPWGIDALSEVLATLLVLAIVVWFIAKQGALKNISALVALVLTVSTISAVVNHAVAFLNWPDPNWQVASCDVGQGDATVVRSDGYVALIDTGKYDDKISTCLNRLAVKHISLLVLTHYDLDHIGAVAAAVKGRVVDTALVTSYHDERPGADWVRTQLELAQIPAVPAEFGMTGRLGKADWEVLNPEHQGGDAEDSNDGSITMLFHLNGYNLIAMADLGERGQMRMAASMGQWYSREDQSMPLVMKVAHHGSADQYPEFIEALHPVVALISVGKNNGYGHPTQRTLDTLGRAGALIARTDLLGSISVGSQASLLAVSGGG